jgi:hypothetical protein
MALVGIQPLFAQYDLPEPELPLYLAAAPAMPRPVSGNRLYLESLSLSRLALDAYEDGNYETSAEFARAAIRYAQLFNEYIALRLQMAARFFPAATLAQAAATDAAPIVPGYIRNNKYYLESLRLTKLAQDTYEYGDYDTSAEFAREAVRYAQLSDEYIALQLKIKEANEAIAAAKQRLDWAVSSGAAGQYPVEYGEAEGFYNESLSARSAEEWDEAIAAAHKVVNILAYIHAPDGIVPRPAQYTVRPWATAKDCLWNIAGRDWAYGDPFQWRILYEANKSKLPQPQNPDLIEPGMVLDIPSLKNEIRQGMWDAGKTYGPLP